MAKKKEPKKLGLVLDESKAKQLADALDQIALAENNVKAAMGHLSRSRQLFPKPHVEEI